MSFNGMGLRVMSTALLCVHVCHQHPRLYPELMRQAVAPPSVCAISWNTRIYCQSCSSRSCHWRRMPRKARVRSMVISCDQIASLSDDHCVRPVHSLGNIHVVGLLQRSRIGSLRRW